MTSHIAESIQTKVKLHSQLEMHVSLVICIILISCNGERILSRKRRYLTFPEGSNFMITLSITKGLMWDIPTGGRPPWNSIVELDALFKLPNTTLQLHERKKRPPHYTITHYDHNEVYKNVPMEFYYHQHRRDRREIYGQIKELLDFQGVDGEACIQRSLCEATSVLKHGRSLVDDLLLVIFSIPEEPGRERAMPTDSCELWMRSCPISLLQLLLS